MLRLPQARVGPVARVKALDVRLFLPGLQRLEHARADGGELRGRRAHDHGDDVAAVGGLRLDQAAGTIDPEADAVAGHAELELARDARSEIAAVRGRRNEEDVRAQLFDDGTHGMAPELGVVVGEPLVLDHDDAFGAVSCRLACRAGDVGAENERHVLAAELPGELASLAEQLERGADRATADVLDQRPAVVALARPLPEPFRFLPRGGVDPPFGQERLQPRCRVLGGREDVAAPLGCHVTYGQDARGRAGLAEALVVLVHLVDEIARGPDLDRSSGALGGFSCVREGEHRRPRELIRLETVIGLANRADGTPLHLQLDDARDVRPAEKGSGFGGNLPRLGVDRLASAQDEVDIPFLLDRERERA